MIFLMIVLWSCRFTDTISYRECDLWTSLLSFQILLADHVQEPIYGQEAHIASRFRLHGSFAQGVQGEQISIDPNAVCEGRPIGGARGESDAFRFVSI